MKKGELQPMQREDVEALLRQIRFDAAMAEESFVEKCLRDIMHGWVPMEQYLKLYPSESANKVHKRVQQGTWQPQVHYAAPRGSTAWVNLLAVRLWLEGRLETDAALRGRNKRPRGE